jgi:YesN/AraC family two-component response regulator
MQLLGSVLHLMFKERVSPEALSPGTPFYEELAAMDSPDEITQWFRYTLVAPYMEEIHRQKENDEESKIGAVVEHIHQHYMKPLSLDSCADQVDMTTHKLSVKFKQHTGTNFIDYLTNIRLTKAKELLETTTMTLQDIAEAVGYQLTYFMRIFKKLEGVTPGQYREERRS